jgi:hypothetical protein
MALSQGGMGLNYIKSHYLIIETAYNFPADGADVRRKNEKTD